MKDLNRVVLIGRLTKDAELRYSAGGTCFARFSLAVNRSRKTETGYTDEVSFFDCDMAGKTAESLSTYLRKGKQIAVEGELVQQRWQQDGQNKSRVTVFVNQLQLLGGNQSNESGNYGGTVYYEPQTAAAAPGPQYRQAQAPQSAEFEDDIPF